MRIRCIEWEGNIFLRKEDVVEFIRRTKELFDKKDREKIDLLARSFYDIQEVE